MLKHLPQTAPTETKPAPKEEEAKEKETAPAPKTPRSRGARAPRPKREPPTGELSETMLFVSNLPYKVKDDDLKAIFQEFKVTSARVVCLRNGMSKGFGFVEVDSHEEQARVLNEFSSIVVDGRELIVKQAQKTQVPRSAEETTE